MVVYQPFAGLQAILCSVQRRFEEGERHGRTFFLYSEQANRPDKNNKRHQTSKKRNKDDASYTHQRRISNRRGHDLKQSKTGVDDIRSLGRATPLEK